MMFLYFLKINKSSVTSISAHLSNTQKKGSAEKESVFAAFTMFYQ